MYHGTDVFRNPFLFQTNTYIMQADFQQIMDYAQSVLNFTLFSLNQNAVTVKDFIVFIIFLSVFIMLGSLVRRLMLKKVFKKYDHVEMGLRYTMARITQYVIVIIGVLISFQFIGISLSSLGVIFGLLSVGIGFGLQNVTSNFISGLIVLFERPVSVGDRVVVNDIEGDVMEINIRSTKIRTLNNVYIIVPNSEFVSKDVVNYSYGDPTYRVDMSVGVSYSSDLDTVNDTLLEIAKANKQVLDTPKPEVHLVEFGDSSWNMQLRVWIRNVKLHPSIRNEINREIVHRFREHEIEIPFPQRDLHLRSPIPLPHKMDSKSA